MKNTLRILSVCLLAVGAAQAVTNVWDGGGINNRWTTAPNWVGDVPFSGGNTSYVIFSNAAVKAQGNTYANYTVKNLTFADELGSTDFTVNISRSTGFDRTLTLDADTGNASIFVKSGSSGNHLINGPMGLTRLGNIALNDDLDIVHNGSGNLTISAPILDGTAAHGINKSGTGALVLNSENTYSGNTTVSAGTLNINNGGSSISNSAIGTGTLDIQGGTIDNTSAGKVTLQTDNAITINTTGFTFGGTQDLDLGTGDVALGLAGAGATNLITLGGSGSTLTLGGAVSAANRKASQTVQVDGAGNTLVMGSLSINASPFTRQNTWSGSADVTVNGGLSAGGGGNFIYDGTGTFTINGASTLTGAMTVSGVGGTLVVNGDNSAATGAVTIDAAATLMGSGTIGGVTLVNGFLKPGNSPGTLTFNSALTLEFASETTFEIASDSSFDLLANDGGDAITFNDGSDIIFDFTGNTEVNYGDSYTVLTTWGSIVDNGAIISSIGLDDSLSLDTSELFTTGAVTVIPEPAALTLIGFGGLGILWLKRRFS